VLEGSNNGQTFPYLVSLGNNFREKNAIGWCDPSLSCSLSTVPIPCSELGISLQVKFLLIVWTVEDGAAGQAYNMKGCLMLLFPTDFGRGYSFGQI
jgi:hypothetical protein